MWCGALSAGWRRGFRRLSTSDGRRRQPTGDNRRATDDERQPTSDDRRATGDGRRPITEHRSRWSRFGCPPPPRAPAAPLARTLRASPACSDRALARHGSSGAVTQRCAVGGRSRRSGRRREDRQCTTSSRFRSSTFMWSLAISSGSFIKPVSETRSSGIRLRGLRRALSSISPRGFQSDDRVFVIVTSALLGGHWLKRYPRWTRHS